MLSIPTHLHPNVVSQRIIANYPGPLQYLLLPLQPRTYTEVYKASDDMLDELEINHEIMKIIGRTVWKEPPGIQRLLDLDSLDPSSDEYLELYQATLQVGNGLSEQLIRKNDSKFDTFKKVKNTDYICVTVCPFCHRKTWWLFNSSALYTLSMNRVANSNK